MARGTQIRRAERLQIESLESRLPLTATLSGAFEPIDAIPNSPNDAQNILQPTSYAAFKINHEQLRADLSGAPLEQSAGQPAVFNLPGPDGSVQQFEIVEAPIMAPELAAKFPQIRTYRGVGVTDPTASLRFDLTPHGFHAQVLTTNGSYYVDPYYHLDTSAYVSYFKADARVDEATQKIRDAQTRAVLDQDGLIDSVRLEAQKYERDAAPAPSSLIQGETLYTHRLAVSATAEYTNFHGGTVADGQAAIVTAINRVTGIFERDFTVRLELVANNDQLVFTSNPDPFSNGDVFAMLEENQMIVDGLIGSANYDVGHVFGIGGGGVAYLGVVGDEDFKAQGVSSLGSPIGDPFSVDYVSHELGHQYDALHTFNGCGAGGGGDSASYEPGSGVTIMAYAGICGIDDLQPNSDAMFHWKSLEEVTSFVTNVIPNVGTAASTGNTGPIADAGPNFAIPTDTPFRLTGSATDVDGDTLTYSWEQADLGPALQLADPDNGESPLFRTYLPTENPVRTLPRLAELVNNTTPVGERMPTEPRNMDWRLVVRDNAPEGGGHDIDAMSINVVDTGASFRVSTPNTNGVTWTGTTTETINWQVAGTASGVIDTPNVNIKLSTDGGFTYPIVLAAAVPNDGSHDIVVPNINTTDARVMVEGDGNIFFDISNFNHTIETADVLPGDFDGNGELECADVDALTIAISSGSNDLAFDVTGDGFLDFSDLEFWVLDLKQTLMGDANLDFIVDGMDFIEWNNNKFTTGTAWCTGDFNADGTTDGLDFIIWNSNKFQSANVVFTDPQLERVATVDIVDVEETSTQRADSSVRASYQLEGSERTNRRASRTETVESHLDKFFADLG